MSAPVDVLIAGAGPAGVATAMRLAQGGLRVRLVDRARFPRDKACAEYLSPGTLDELSRLGVLDQVDHAGGEPLAGTRVFGPRGSSLTGLFAATSRRPFRAQGLALTRRTLDALLVDAARRAGVEVCEATAVEELLHRDGAVAGAVLRHDGQRRACAARLVVGADGLRSIVAQRLGGRRHVGPRRMALVAHMTGVTAMADTAQMHVGLRRYVGLNPLGPGLTNVAAVVPATELRAARGRPEGFLRDVLAEFPELDQRTREARCIGQVMVTGPFAVRSRRIVADGALLVGDAADFFDPFTGEGIYSALRGGALAAEAALAALADGGRASARRLQPYRSARRTAFLGKWTVERLIGWSLEAPALFDRLVGRLERSGLGHTLVGVTGNALPARAILNWRTVAALVR